MDEQYEKFRELLTEMFMFDRADLDFGMYRILNKKRGDIENFLDNRMHERIGAILGHSQGRGLSRYRTTIADANLTNTASNVYNHLTTFFARYYDKGDFISRRRYNRNGSYAIPYNGEEVKLHWANADQYYVKSDKYFRNYTFKTADGSTVNFQLREADTELNNNKEADDDRRKFIVAGIDEHDDKLPLNEILEFNGPREITVFFAYAPHKESQKALNKRISGIIMLALRGLTPYPEVFDRWLSRLMGNSAVPEKTVIAHHVDTYTAVNSYDFFIHKNLGAFLRRELDFYVKNEIFNLDGIDEESAMGVSAVLDQVRAVRAVGHEIIAFLHQIEEFQRKLWLKRKFVVSTDYCLTVDRIPERLRKAVISELARSKEQIAEWQQLFAIEELEGGTAYPLSEEFIGNQPHLVIDTKFLRPILKEALLEAFDDIDAACDGLLVHSENFQALNLLQAQYRQKIKCIYADPPYNTSEETFIYKNSFQHSSWISMIHNRVSASKILQSEDGGIIITIDDAELYNLKLLISTIYSDSNFIGNIVVQSNPRGRGINSHYATSHEYALVYANSKDLISIANQPLTPQQVNDFRNTEGEIPYRLLPFRRSGGLSTPDVRPNSEFSLIYSKSKKLIIGVGDERIKPFPNEYKTKHVLTLNSEGRMVSHDYDKFTHDKDIIIIMPVDSYGSRRVWRWSDRLKILQAAMLGDFVVSISNDNYIVKLKDYIKDGRKPKTIWSDSKYDASSHGTNLLRDLFGERRLFGYPKSLFSSKDAIHSLIGEDENSITLDFFAGSGTTGHAVINLNREDGGQRRYILVEMGAYFDTVTKPRIQKVVYSDSWKNGKPVDRAGTSHMFKYVRLESYEDTLNNLAMTGNALSRQMAGERVGGDLHADYMLTYMLDAETASSSVFLGGDIFERPFSQTMRIATGSVGQTVEQLIDVVETFNYLIGLRVRRYFSYYSGSLRVICGTTNTDNKKVAVVWRDLGDVSDKQTWDHLSGKQETVRMLNEADIIYVNGDSTGGNLVDPNKLRIIDGEFRRLMFDDRNVE